MLSMIHFGFKSQTVNSKTATVNSWACLEVDGSLVVSEPYLQKLFISVWSLLVILSPKIKLYSS